MNSLAGKTPDNFIFAVKVPHVITHEKMLQGAHGDFKNFVETTDLLREKLGPMLLEFPYFNRTNFKSGGEFRKLVQAFMKKFPKDPKFAVEIRNRNWLDERLAGALHERSVALVLQDQSHGAGAAAMATESSDGPLARLAPAARAGRQESRLVSVWETDKRLQRKPIEIKHVNVLILSQNKDPLSIH